MDHKHKTSENALLLNAIKNKFAADTTTKNEPQASGTSPLNQFLLRQLQERSTHNTKNGTDAPSFVLPNLQAFGNETKPSPQTFEIPLLKTSASSAKSSNSISSLTTAINKLQVGETPNTNITSIPVIPAITTPPAIDLSTALASKSTHQGTPPTRVFQVKQNQSSKADVDFDIPFIDCDRLESKSKVFAPANEYCQIDISEIRFEPSCVQEPSAVGHFLCIVDKHYIQVPLKYITSVQQYKDPVKHSINPFQFDTKSPDDIVMASLEKYKRRHF